MASIVEYVVKGSALEENTLAISKDRDLTNLLATFHGEKCTSHYGKHLWSSDSLAAHTLF